MNTVVIYLGGQGPNSAPDLDGEIIATIAADSGLNLADNHGAHVELIVGDMDSVDIVLLAKYENQGTIISRFPHDKEETDFELAIMAAKSYIADSIVVIGGGGERLDHLLANIAVLAGPQTDSFLVEAYLANSHLKICRPSQPINWEGTIGDEVSLVPIGPNVVGVRTSGFKWELENETLSSGSARGISNVQTNSKIEVSCESGALAVIKSSNEKV